jgi:hypothetical protein
MVPFDLKLHCKNDKSLPKRGKQPSTPKKTYILIISSIILILLSTFRIALSVGEREGIMNPRSASSVSMFSSNRANGRSKVSIIKQPSEEEIVNEMDSIFNLPY